MTLHFNPGDPAFRANPYPMLARLRTEDPVHWSPALKSWVLTRYDDVKRALGASEMSPDRLTPFYASLPDATRSTLAEAMRYLNLWIVFRDPPEHTRLRSLVNKAFLPGTITSFRPQIENIITRLLDGLEPDSEVDLVAQFTMQLPALVIMGMLGVEQSHLYRIKAWSDDIMLFIGSAQDTPGKYELARRGAHEMAAFFRAEIAKRRAQPGSDLLSLLISARDERDSLSEDELVATAMLLLFAGHETTTNLLSTATLALIRTPDQRQRFIREPELAGTAVEEFLRYDAPTNAMTRIVRTEHEVGGKVLKTGDRVFAIINAANRDETQFAVPDRLDIGRTPNRHLTFGQGIHFCLGAQLARLEARIALPLLLERFPGIALSRSEPVWLDALIMRGLKSLPVALGRVA
ncbi:MAG: cytochrome P450 [Hyphomicrobiaceae bacterium]|jgi:cytochrome P450